MTWADETVDQFLRTLWPQPFQPDERLLVWTLPNKLSAWCTDIEGAVKVAVRAAVNQDVYIGCGLGPAGLGTRQRALNAQVTAIPGLWADIDYSDAVHKKTNLPTREEAERLIDEISAVAEPTVVLHSGHGYQLWWCFDKPWRFDNEEARRDAAYLEKAWVERIKHLAAQHAWDVDSTVDLARVLRVPGTVNHKGGDAVPVTLEKFDGPRHTRPSLQKLTPEQRIDRHWSGPPELREVSGDLVMAANAQPPFDKFEALLSNEPRFRTTWERTRKDMTDRSPSAWDMSLANYAVAADWSDQEIVDLLIAGRRKHGDDLKLRDDYYRRTITKAGSERTIHQAAGLNVKTAAGKPVTEGDLPTREAAIAALSEQFFNGNGVTIESLQKYSGDPPIFVLQLSIKGQTQSITLGQVDAILRQQQFRSAVAASVGVLVPEVTKKQWEARAQALLNVVVEYDLGDVASPTRQVQNSIEEYLDAHPAAQDDAVQTALQARRPYIFEGYLSICLNALAQWLHQSYGERITRKELARYMKMAGWEQYTQYMQATRTTPATSRSVWRKDTLGPVRFGKAS